MTGICGWFGAHEAAASELIAAMGQRITWNGRPGQCSLIGSEFGLAAIGPPETIGAFEFGNVRIAFHGHGRWRDGGNGELTPSELCERLAAAYRERGADAFTSLGGDFALALIDLDRRTALLAVDRMGIRNLVYRLEQSVLVFAANLDSLAAHPLIDHRINPQALYNYVYFHMVPGPDTIFQRSRRLLPGHYVRARAGEVITKPYWNMEFDEARCVDQAELAREFRAILRTCVHDYALNRGCGTFLSGGTDSSTVTGVLSELCDTTVGSYSIGFDVAGYDEMGYARIAARQFRTDHHEYYVTPADVVAAIPQLAAEYDQPFGNASAVPTYYCAKLACSAGVTRMLAGDGGDELFGGNARYGRQYQLSLYERLPSLLRTHLIEPLLHTRAALTLPLLRKGRSYVEQARLQMPARYESYNLLERLGPENVFERDFLAGVKRGEPLGLLLEVYRSTNAVSLINGMSALDLKFTLADNDLPKVTRMCDRAGVDVAFPLLHEAAVSFSAALAPQLKLRGTRLRYFFKEALRDFLPREIIAKQKHGFGLPVGRWLVDYDPLGELARDALASLGQRRIFKRKFLEDLVDTRVAEHAAYYGTMVWILMMLELWFEHHVDSR